MIINSEFPYHITPGALNQISNLKATSKLLHLQGLGHPFTVWSIRIWPGNEVDWALVGNILCDWIECHRGNGIHRGRYGLHKLVKLISFPVRHFDQSSDTIVPNCICKKDPTNFWPIRWLYTHIIIEFPYSTARYSALLSPWNQYAIIKGSKWGRHIPVVSTSPETI